MHGEVCMVRWHGESVHGEVCMVRVCMVSRDCVRVFVVCVSVHNECMYNVWTETSLEPRLSESKSGWKPIV